MARKIPENAFTVKINNKILWGKTRGCPQQENKQQKCTKYQV